MSDGNTKYSPCLENLGRTVDAKSSHLKIPRESIDVDLLKSQSEPWVGSFIQSLSSSRRVHWSFEDMEGRGYGAINRFTIDSPEAFRSFLEALDEEHKKKVLKIVL